MASVKSGTWRNWAGNVTARPVREVAPASVEELATAVRKAAEDGLKVKAVGTGHLWVPKTYATRRYS
jgi:FAD/FMN-containing dehydrogenase